MKRSAFPATPAASGDDRDRGADASSRVTDAPGVRLAHGADEPSPARGPWATLADAAAITRFHILLIAAVAALVFGWLMTGRYPWAVAVLTHVGTAQLVLFLVGTALWREAGLPINVYLSL